jgi:hypothetical protein
MSYSDSNIITTLSISNLLSLNTLYMNIDSLTAFELLDSSVTNLNNVILNNLTELTISNTPLSSFNNSFPILQTLALNNMNNSNLIIDLSQVPSLQNFSMSKHIIYLANNSITSLSISNLANLSNILLSQTPNLTTFSLVNLPSLTSADIPSSLVSLTVNTVPILSNFTNYTMVDLTTLTLINMSISTFSNNSLPALVQLQMSNCVLIQPTSAPSPT